jgi:hypothetical protein
VRLRELLILALLGLPNAGSVKTIQAQGAISGSHKIFGRISKVRIDRSDARPGPLFIVAEGKEIKVSDQALNAWIIGDKQQVAYSGVDGAGGYENEGQSLRVYDASTRTQRKIMAEYFAIDRVEEVRTSNGKRALIVEMRDSGLGASHLAVVDPNRGEVFAISKAAVVGRHGDQIVIGYFHEEDWETMAQGNAVQPYRTEHRDLKELLRRQVITKKRAP